jgi:hypothetical protein
MMCVERLKMELTEGCVHWCDLVLAVDPVTVAFVLI